MYFVALIFSCAFASQVFAQAYYHDSGDLPQRADWMRQLPDTTRLSEMSIPGTHDSAALKYGGDIVLTQSLTITRQLNGGVRFLDLRARHINNVFAMHHGPVYQGAMFGDVLGEMIDFLRRHPSETIIARLKEEHDPAGNTRSFEQTFKSYYDPNRQWFASPGENNPSLGTLRGKILILADYSRSDRSYGRSYGGLNAQDAYSVSTNWDLYGKWEKVKSQLSKAAESRNGTIHINYLSASGGAFPYFIASGKSSPGTHAPQLVTGRTTIGAWADSWPDFPRTACLGSWCTIEFLGTNGLTVNYLNGKSWRGLGIVAADFPGPDLIGALVRANANTRLNRIVQVSTGRCIDAEGTLKPGGSLQLMPCRRHSAQDIRIDDLNMAVGGASSRLCMDVRSGIPTDHQSVILYDCHGDTNQQWVTREDGRIQSQRRSLFLQPMCLTVEGFPSRLTVRPCQLRGADQVFAVRQAP
ncbi:phosphatidylinositol-specific phospholipase C domain-containing protein [Dyella sp. 2RAB6]|uniref:phosphatidylinositol-specific phospholipase C domain-containing protein n=1 Tax=Dyella sp. 2RAB6 TaxID=3232992 RepID=UPI003F8F5637